MTQFLLPKFHKRKSTKENITVAGPETEEEQRIALNEDKLRNTSFIYVIRKVKGKHSKLRHTRNINTWDMCNSLFTLRLKTTF